MSLVERSEVDWLVRDGWHNQRKASPRRWISAQGLKVRNWQGGFRCRQDLSIRVLRGLGQGSANSFSKGPDSKYFRL